MENHQYSYSQLAANALPQFLTMHYDFAERPRCKYYVLGLHDNYLVECGSDKYIFRVYRNSWRTETQILFELELLAYLGRKKSPVAAPLPTKTGQYCFTIDSPEGLRFATLFRYAKGRAPGSGITASTSALLGAAVATVHYDAVGFTTTQSRPLLDLPYLLTESIDAILPFIEPQEREFLKRLEIDLSGQLNRLTGTTPGHSICIGDVNLSNFHIDTDNTVTIFDFDQCGYGHRAFEIGKFVSSIHSLENKQEIAAAFIQGYEKIFALKEDEFAAIPLYEKVSVIWVMAIHAYNAERIGHKWLEKPFWDRRFAVLRDLEQHPTILKKSPIVAGKP